MEPAPAAGRSPKVGMRLDPLGPTHLDRRANSQRRAKSACKRLKKKKKREKKRVTDLPAAGPENPGEGRPVFTVATGAAEALAGGARGPLQGFSRTQAAWGLPSGGPDAGLRGPVGGLEGRGRSPSRRDGGALVVGSAEAARGGLGPGPGTCGCAVGPARSAPLRGWSAEAGSS